MRFFIAGIMQGSHLGAILHNQEYRARLRRLLAEHFPGAEIYDPLADHQNSLNYDDELARSVFMHHNELCCQTEVLVAFVPEASMGTAVEMWEAWRHGQVVLTISPLKHNWVVKFLSHRVYADAEEFAAELATGQVRRLVEQVLAARRDQPRADDRSIAEEPEASGPGDSGQ